MGLNWSMVLVSSSVNGAVRYWNGILLSEEKRNTNRKFKEKDSELCMLIIAQTISGPNNQTFQFLLKVV